MDVEIDYYNSHYVNNLLCSILNNISNNVDTIHFGVFMQSPLLLFVSTFHRLFYPIAYLKDEDKLPSLQLIYSLLYIWA